MKTHLSVNHTRQFIVATADGITGLPACGANRGINRTLQSGDITLTDFPSKVTCQHCMAFMQAHPELFEATVAPAWMGGQAPPETDHLAAANELLKRAAARLKSAKVRGSFITLLDRVRELVVGRAETRLDKAASAAAEGIIARLGLLWRGGKSIPLPEADRIASQYGYRCAEEMVRALSK